MGILGMTFLEQLILKTKLLLISLINVFFVNIYVVFTLELFKFIFSLYSINFKPQSFGNFHTFAGVFRGLKVLITLFVIS